MVGHMPKPSEVELVSTAILAGELGVDVRTIHRMVGRGELKGVLPILFVFLARTGKVIQSVEYVSLDR